MKARTKKRDLAEIRKMMDLSQLDIAEFLSFNTSPGPKRRRLKSEYMRMLVEREIGKLKPTDMKILFEECLFTVMQGAAGWFDIRAPRMCEPEKYEHLINNKHRRSHRAR